MAKLTQLLFFHFMFLECALAQNRELCAGHGFCAMDSDAETARCFCNSGFHGSDCFSTGNYVQIWMFVALVKLNTIFCVQRCVWLWVQLERWRSEVSRSQVWLWSAIWTIQFESGCVKACAQKVNLCLTSRSRPRPLLPPCPCNFEKQLLFDGQWLQREFFQEKNISKRNFG